MARALLGSVLRSKPFIVGIAVSALAVLPSPTASAGGKHDGPPVESAGAFRHGLQTAVFECATAAYAAGVVPEGSWRVSYRFARKVEVVRSATGSVSTPRRIYLEATTVDAEPGSAAEVGDCLRVPRKEVFPTDGFSNEPYGAQFSIDATVSFTAATCSPDGQARSMQRIAIADGRVEEHALPLGKCTPSMWADACEAAGNHPDEPESQDWLDATLSSPPIVPAGVAECDTLRERYVSGSWAAAEAAARMGQLPTLDSILSGFLHPTIAPIISSVRWSEAERVPALQRTQITVRLREHGTWCFFETLDAAPNPTLRGRILFKVSATGAGSWTVNAEPDPGDGLAACLAPHLSGEWSTKERMVSATVAFGGGPDRTLADFPDKDAYIKWLRGARLPDSGEFAEAMALRKVVKIRLAADQDPVGAYATLVEAASEGNRWTHVRAVAAVLAEQVAALPEYAEATRLAAEEAVRSEAIRSSKASFYADDGLLTAFGADSVSHLIVASAKCGVANRQFHESTCDARVNASFQAKWCAANWTGAVAAAGREVALEVLDEFCGQQGTTVAYGYTWRGRNVEFSTEACLAEIKSWCR